MEFTFKAGVYKFTCWLKFQILGSLSTTTNPTPYPKENPRQHWFSTRKLIIFTQLHKLWYEYDVLSEKLSMKILVPACIFDNFSGITLAFWIMGDGYWENYSKTIFLCTESFTELEVDFLIDVLYKKLNH